MRSAASDTGVAPLPIAVRLIMQGETSPRLYLWELPVRTARSAYTLVELIIVVAFIGIMAAIAVPRFNLASIDRQKASTTAGKIVTALRRTRTLAISDAAVNSQGYALVMTGSAPYSGYQIKNLSTQSMVDSQTINQKVLCTGGPEFKFGPLGSLLSGSATQLVISASDKTVTITLTSATGMVRLTND